MIELDSHDVTSETLLKTQELEYSTTDSVLFDMDRKL